MTAAGTKRALDTNLRGNKTKLLVQQLSHKFVGQEKAVQTMVNIYESYQAGFIEAGKPIGNALFLGPTGCGKTHLCEMFAEAIWGNKNAVLRIDCSEYQHSHEIAKIVGSPSGYLGHRETPALLNQKRLDQYHTDANKFSIILLDEIEKASDALWILFLGILDKASLTLGTNEVVDFSKTIIVMTSNLGAREMAKKDIGYGAPSEEYAAAVLEQKAMSAVKAKFTPEFLNRLHHVVMFETLTEAQIEQILEIELAALSERIFKSTFNRGITSPSDVHMFSVMVSPKAKRTLIEQGYDKAYGARELKRIIDKMIERPLAKLYNSEQINDGDIIVVDDAGTGEFDFYSHPSVMARPLEPVPEHTCTMRCYNSDGIRICEKK